jgi:hypothetical protein
MNTQLDRQDLSYEIKQLIRSRLQDVCAQHPDKAMAWVYGNISNFVDGIGDDLKYFAKHVVPKD